jgi:hypothetical protein
MSKTMEARRFILTLTGDRSTLASDLKVALTSPGIRYIDPDNVRIEEIPTDNLFDDANQRIETAEAKLAKLRTTHCLGLSHASQPG